MLCQYLGRRIAEERSQVLRIHQENYISWKNHLGPGQIPTCVCWGIKLKYTWSNSPWTILQKVLAAHFWFCRYFSSIPLEQHSPLFLYQSPARCWDRISWFPLFLLFLWALQSQILSCSGDHSTNMGVSQWALVTSAQPKVLSRFILSKSLRAKCLQRGSWLGLVSALEGEKKNVFEDWL